MFFFQTADRKCIHAVFAGLPEREFGWNLLGFMVFTPNILNIRNANDYRPYVRLEDRYPLVSVVAYADVSPVRSSLNNYEVWFFKVL